MPTPVTPTIALQLSTRNWWQELEDADISQDARLMLRSAVTAYLRDVIPPTHDGKLERLIIDVGPTILLGREILRLTTDGIRFRLVPLGAPPGLPIPLEVPGERIYELVAARHQIGCGVALVELTESKEHWHTATCETYTLVDGALDVFLNGTPVSLDRIGQSIVIPPGTHHWARTRTAGRPAKIVVTTVPPWSPDDHHLDEAETA